MTQNDEGDARARFEALVQSFSADLYRYAFWLCRNRDTAEELVQETFLRAWRSIDNLRDEKAAKGWLFTIVRREHARLYERKRLDMLDDPDFERVPGARGYDTSTEAFVLRRALAELPEDYREPLVLQVIGGYTAEEIGQMLGISAGAVMTRLFRARKKMRELLEGDAEASAEVKK
ncbi:sigma-70 family RNA polymerase sigma factor [Inmirania thermothiophila]|uniref:RNA polymerase sigma-70 factor (ECF subfamily) n=1 Tax=Inmirania thermothiophila TaxID=1750597 RepID=A0A3N1Y735_9GAMM|nr:sigma-70 family RNA polymerase sigma factor [Inmirania thermothiophila]ROR34626.1 RNA polymerase sigma-70 factor (ECF subfamily) [Inmirania thermothiophila]